MEITIGNLMDQISVVNIRIWFAEDVKRDPKATDTQIANACRITNAANKQRNDLIQAIDKYFGIDNPQGDTKIYGKINK